MIWDDIKRKAADYIDETKGRLAEPQLTSVEKKTFEEIRSLRKMREVDLVLSSILGKIPTIETPLNRGAIRLLLRHDQLAEALKKGRAEAETVTLLKQEMEHQRRAEEQRRIEDEQNRSYFNIFHYRGVAYGGSKYTERSGDYIKPVTEFFLKSQGRDHHVKLVGYDLPFANGQEIIVVYAGVAPSNNGYAVQYCNINLKIIRDLVDEHSRVSTTFGKTTSARLHFELQRYKQKL